MASSIYGYENYIVEETSQSADTTQTQEGKGDDGPHEDIVTLIGQHVQGSYCKYVFSRLQKNEKDGQCNPRPSKGIVVKKGCKKCPWAIESFFEDPDQFIKEMDRCANLCKDQREQFILHKILPHLEESWGKCSSNNEDVYKMLTKLSCVINSGTVVKHSLQLLLHLICQDNFGSESGNLLVLEKIVRTSIFSSEGMFRKDEHSERKLKLFSYSRILSLLLIQQVRQDELQIIDMIEDLSKVQMEIKRRCDQLENKQKDVLRYSMELILRATSYLLKPKENWQLATRIRSSIAECQEFCENSDKESKDLKILRAIKERNRNGEWLDLHCLLIHLHEKVHCERPVPQMETERRAMILIRLIVEAYLQGEGGADWRFCLFASSLLVDIAKNNVTKEMRKEAGGCLVNLLKNRKLQKRPECRAILERRSSELLLCRDHEIRTFLVHFLSQNRHSEDTLRTSLHTDHLCSTYGTQKLETNKSSIHHSLHCFIKHGMFQTGKVAVKVLYVKKHHLLEEDPKFEARKRLIREADNMRRLTACQHPNFPVLLGYNTEQLPYHLITAFESHGNLLQLVRRSREREPHLKPIQLLEMLTGISRALLYLEELGLVHRSVMAENILVGDNFVCKLGGLHSLRQLTRGPVNQADWSLLHGYCSAEVPEYASTFRDEDLPVRWKAPECLQEHRYSTASDVWAFGVLMYEVLTYGCTPYRHILKDEEVPTHVLDYKEIVPLELCFENREYELIKQCCEWSLNHRLKLTDANERLTEILRSSENGSRQDPPPLEMEDVRGISNQDSEELYSTIQDMHDDNEFSKMKSIEEDQEMTCALYDDITDDQDIVKKDVQNSKMIWERLSQQDEEHVRGLKALNNPHLASISSVDFINSHYWINSPECGNLKEYVLDRQCKQEHIVMFLSQVASALHYLHVNHIVHGNLRAEYVNVVAPDKVQVGRLGRSKTLTLSEYEETSTSCVVQASMPPDSTRWSAPEVILDGHYTHAADAWAFGILAWELYTSYHHGQEWRKFAEPYQGLSSHEILSYMRDIGPLRQPQGCPRWVSIIMHQCWAFDSAQRPPFLAIVDCLTSREPMQSWIMQVWLKTHEEKDWPDLSICQEGEHVTHVLDAEKHPSVQSIEKMCSEDFFAKHGYRYVDRSVDEADDEPYASCRQVPDPKRSPSHESKLPSVEDASGYLCPLEETISKRDGTELQNYNENEEHNPSNTTVNYIMFKRPPNETFDDEMSSETDQRQTTYAEIKVKNFNLGEPNRASNTDHRDCTIRDKPAVPNSRHGKGLGIGQNKEDAMGEEDCTIYEEPHTERGQPSPFKRGQTIRRKKATGINSRKQAKLETENKENIYENSTARFQDVSEMEHVYENSRNGNEN